MFSHNPARTGHAFNWRQPRSKGNSDLNSPLPEVAKWVANGLRTALRVRGEKKKKKKIQSQRGRRSNPCFCCRLPKRSQRTMYTKTCCQRPLISCLYIQRHSEQNSSVLHWKQKSENSMLKPMTLVWYHIQPERKACWGTSSSAVPWHWNAIIKSMNAAAAVKWQAAQLLSLKCA